MKMKVPSSKPRNPFALVAASKGAAAGVHRKPGKALRRLEKIRLREVLRGKRGSDRDGDCVVERSSMAG